MTSRCGWIRKPVKRCGALFPADTACTFQADRRGLQWARSVRMVPAAGASSSMKIVRVGADELFVGERLDLTRFDQHDVIGVLHDAFDDEKRLFRDQEPHPLE